MKSALRSAVAAICFAATALPACGSSSHEAGSDSGPGDAGTKSPPGNTSDGAVAPRDGAPPAPSTCAKDENCTPETECSGGKCVTKAVCPSGLEPTFDSIRTKILSVSCGTDGNTCHSRDGSINSAGLNFADDPYVALLGSDGKGEPATNLSGSEKNLVRVVPGDPDHSFLVIKLSTRTGMDPKYGSGMPFTDPGSVCPDTLGTIREWIAAGAKK